VERHRGAARDRRQIVGIEIAVKRLQGKWTVRQNRGRRVRLGVEAGLQAEPGDDARAMSALVRPPPDSAT
jgi:transcriptional regulator